MSLPGLDFFGAKFIHARRCESWPCEKKVILNGSCPRRERDREAGAVEEIHQGVDGLDIVCTVCCWCRCHPWNWWHPWKLVMVLVQWDDVEAGDRVTVSTYNFVVINDDR